MKYESYPLILQNNPKRYVEYALSIALCRGVQYQQLCWTIYGVF